MLLKLFHLLLIMNYKLINLFIKLCKNETGLKKIRIYLN